MIEFLKQLRKYATTTFQNSRLIEHLLDFEKIFDNNFHLAGLAAYKLFCTDLDAYQQKAITSALKVC